MGSLPTPLRAKASIRFSTSVDILHYEAVKRRIKINRPTQLRKLTLARLKERFRRENIPLPERGGGRRGGLI